MFARYASAVTSGTFMTLALLYTMQTLISLQPGAITDPPPTIPVIYRMIDDPDSPVHEEELIVDKKKLIETWETPPLTKFTGGSDPIRVPVSDPQPPVDDSKIDFSLSDGTLINLVRVGPVYPAKALARGLEGYVIVQFDVNPDGQVTNAVAVESSHRVFEKAAVNAAYRFKFKPRIVDGQPQLSTGVRNLFRFEIDE